MRLSVNKQDKGYHQNAHKYEVYVDDVLLKDCETVDIDKAEAVIFPRDKNGFLQARNGVMVRETLDLTGKNVEIRGVK